MFARTVMLESSPDRIDSRVEAVRHRLMAPVLGLPACRGLSLVVDRAAGTGIVTTAWESAEAMRAAAERAWRAHEPASELLGAPVRGRGPDPGASADWEVAVVHRRRSAPETACARAAWLCFHPADADDLVELYRVAVLPAQEELDGFCSATLLLDRPGGRAVSTVTFTDRAALARSRGRAMAARPRSGRHARLEITDMHEFDLVLAHLHLPEQV